APCQDAQRLGIGAVRKGQQRTGSRQRGNQFLQDHRFPPDLLQATASALVPSSALCEPPPSHIRSTFNERQCRLDGPFKARYRPFGGSPRGPVWLRCLPAQSTEAALMRSSALPSRSSTPG